MPSTKTHWDDMPPQARFAHLTQSSIVLSRHTHIHHAERPGELPGFSTQYILIAGGIPISELSATPGDALRQAAEYLDNLSKEVVNDGTRSA